MEAAVYVRISSDVAGDALGVARQERDCRALAKRMGWTVSEVFRENDTSAFQRRRVRLADGSTALRVVRPEYRRMLGALADGRVKALVAYDLDRVARDIRDLEDLIDIVEDRGIPTASVTGSLDLSNDSGIFTARLMVNVANKSSRDTARRVKRKLAENAEQGKHHGGSRPFGWEDDRVTLRPHEAEAVRMAVRMLLAGNSVKAIVRALNAAGFLNSVRTSWNDATVRSMLLRARNAGLRIHHGEVVGEGQWERIIDRDDWEQVRLLLTDPVRRTTPGASGRTYLLSGVARCGVCGGPLRGAKGKPYKGVTPAIYRCYPSGCVSRGRAVVEDLVRDVVCARLALPDAADLLRPQDEPQEAALAREELERLRARIRTLAARYADGEVDEQEWDVARTRLKAHIAVAERAIPEPMPQQSVLEGLAGEPDVRQRWDALDVSVQRQVVAALLEVVVQPTRRGPGFDPNSVTLTWKGAR